MWKYDVITKSEDGGKEIILGLVVYLLSSAKYNLEDYCLQNSVVTDFRIIILIYKNISIF